MGGFVFGSGGGSGNSVDFLKVTMEPQFGLSGKKFYDRSGNLVPGTILNWDGTVLSGASTDGNKVIVTPDSVAQHIAAGKYLGRDIEFAAMAAGSAEMSREDNVVTLTKQAGWIGAGTPTLTIPAYNGSNSITPGASAQTLSLAGLYCLADIIINGDANLKAANIKSGVNIFGIMGSYSGQSYSTYSGATTITPSSSNQYFYTNGYVVNSNLKVSGDSNLKAANIKSGVNIFGVSGSYTGATPTVGTGSLSGDSSHLVISAPSGYTLYMAAFIVNPVPGGVSYVSGGMVRYGYNSGRGVYVTSTGTTAVANISASFSGRSVTITPASGYTFYGTNYDAYIVYA